MSNTSCKNEVKQAANGRWAEIIPALSNIQANVLDGKPHPCPMCREGNDRFSAFPDFAETGGVMCRKCHNQKNSDGLATLIWLNGWNFPEALKAVGEHLGIKPPKIKTKRPIEKINLVDLQKDDHGDQFRVQLESWLKSKPGISAGAIEAFDGKWSGFPKGSPDPLSCLTFCGRKLDQSNDAKAVLLYRLDGKDFEPYKTLGKRKIHLVGGSQESWIWPGTVHDLKAAKVIVKCEGVADALAVWSLGLPDGWLPITNSCGAKSTGKLAFGWAKGKQILIIGDCDEPGQDGAKRFGSKFHHAGAMEVKLLKLPYEMSTGKDARDWVAEGNHFDDLKSLAESTEPLAFADIDEKEAKKKSANDDMDPAEAAKSLLLDTEKDGHYQLRFHRGEFYWWSQGKYGELPVADTRARVTRSLNERWSGVKRSHISDTLEQIKALCIVPHTVDPPQWLTDADGHEWPTNETLVTQNEIIHLPSLLNENCDTPSVPATPALFNTVALPFKFEGKDCPEPKRWLKFLDQIWGDDRESIEALKMWFGYCLVPDTSQQKMLSMFGPKRSGKGTVARIQTAMVGKGNIASPTLSSLCSPFGLQPLVGKSLAIIADARLSGRSDSAIITERILSITGEDAQTIDKKYLPQVTCTLPTRIMMISNEIPRLNDASGALASRMIVLRFTKSFYGNEDHGLTVSLMKELPGILWWSIRGWQNLRERGRLLQPESGLEMIRDMEDLGSPVAAFVRQDCEVGLGKEVAKADLFRSFKRWCEEHGKSHVPDEAGFGRDLIAAHPDVRSSRPRRCGTRLQIYTGIGLA